MGFYDMRVLTKEKGSISFSMNTIRASIRASVRVTASIRASIIKSSVLNIRDLQGFFEGLIRASMRVR